MVKSEKMDRLTLDDYRGAIDIPSRTGRAHGSYMHGLRSSLRFWILDLEPVRLSHSSSTPAAVVRMIGRSQNLVKWGVLLRSDGRHLNHPLVKSRICQTATMLGLHQPLPPGLTDQTLVTVSAAMHCQLSM
jgi:hypothetical protein